MRNSSKRARAIACFSLCCALAACGANEEAERGTRNRAGAGGSAGQAAVGGGAGLSITRPIETPENPSADCNDKSGSLGCSFYSVRPPRGPATSFADKNGACFAAFVVNASGVEVSIDVEFQGMRLDTQKLARIPRGSGTSLSYQPLPSGKLPPNEVAILFLTQSPHASMPCPSEVGYERLLTLEDLTGTGYDKAFHITTSAPVAAYDIFPYGGGASAVSSATLLLPTTVWDTNYVAVSPYIGTTSFPGAIQLVAAEDDTEVTLAPRVDTQPGRDVAESKAGQSQVYKLMRGDVLQLAPFPGQELSGSPLLANKSFGLWGASACASIPSGVQACDSLHQQIPPVRALGSHYVALRHRDRFEARTEQAPFRVVGAVDGTRLSYSAAPSGAPTSLQAGQVVEFRADAPFSVASQDPEHPFYLATYMSGCAEVSKDGLDCRGDPEFVNVVPTEQYASSYVFFTDPTYPETSLALVRKRKDGAFKQVVLDCLGAVADWQPISGSADYEYARVDLVRGNYEAQGKCDNGRHEVKSDAPFAVTVWGWGSARSGGIGLTDPGYSQCVSYAYPAGAGVRVINTTVVQPVIK